MIICRNCGHHNPDDADFCEVCNHYLEWEGERIEPEPEPEREPEPDPAPEPDRGLVQRVRDLVGLDEEEAREVASSRAVAETVAATDEERAEDETDEDAAARIRTEAAAKAEAEADAADRAQREAQEEVDERVAAAEEARREAEAADAARRAAEERAEAEAEEARHLRERLQELEGRLEQASGSRGEADEQQAAARRAREEVEAAERAQAVAQARADAETEAAREARERAEAAERARDEAERKAAAEAEAAERARRAAALVSKPTPTEDDPGRAPRPPEPVDEETGTDEARADRTGRDDGSEEPDRRGPGPKRPQEVATRSRRRAKAQRKTPRRRIRPGDLICGVCGTGNDPERNFCRRCGNPLAEAEKAPEPSLWERVRQLFRRRDPEPVAAGERPMRPGGGMSDAAARGRSAKRKVLGTWITVMKALAVAGVVVGVVGVSISPLRQDVTGWFGDRFQSIKRLVVPEFEPVNAVGASATSETEGHPAGHAVDLLKNTWWAEADPGPGDGTQLFVELGDPVDIAKVGFLNGAADEETFLAQPRPREVHLVFSNGATRDVTLADSQEFQVFDVEGAAGVTSVEIQILSVYPGQDGEEMSLTEVEFRTRK